MVADPVSVLVVDDDAAIRRLLRTLLVRADVEVDAVPDGHDALERLESRPYSVIILDLMMPTIGGLELLDRVSQTMPDILSRIIILTAASPQSINALQADGRVWGVIRKPFDIDDLLRSVADCAAQRGALLEM